MDKRAGEPLNGLGGSDTDAKSAAIRTDIDRTRAEMSRTVDEIEQRLSPAHIKEQVADIKDSVLGHYHDAKNHLKDDITHELSDAKSRVRSELRHARTAVHDATVGRVQHMVHDARETVSDAGTTLFDTIRQNPVPAAMIAVGLGWLLMSGRNPTAARPRPRGGYRLRDEGWYEDEDYRYPSRSVYGWEDEERFGYEPSRGRRGVVERGQRRIGEAMHAADEQISHARERVQRGANHIADRARDVGEAATNLAYDAGERAQHIASDAREAVVHFADDARRTGRRVVRRAEYQARRAEAGFETALTDNPLAFGAVALALGAAAGLALPHTEAEDQWMGGTKDKLVDRAEDLAHGALEKVEQKASQLTAGPGSGENKPYGAST